VQFAADFRAVGGLERYCNAQFGTARGLGICARTEASAALCLPDLAVLQAGTAGRRRGKYDNSLISRKNEKIIDKNIDNRYFSL